MKNFFMIFGLALVAGVGVFALSDSFADVQAGDTVVSQNSAGCTACGSTCHCSTGNTCGDASCKYSSETTESTCGATCSGGSTCGATSGSSCAALSFDSSSKEKSTSGCGCSRS